MSHLVKVDDCEAVCLSGPHVLHTEEEPLCVLVCVEIKTKIEFIVPSTTGGGAGAGGEEREAWRGREREGGMREEEGNITIWMVTHHSHIPLTLPHSTHTCTAFARLPLSNRDSNIKVVLSGGKVGVAFGVTLGPARAQVNCTKDVNHQLLTNCSLHSPLRAARMTGSPKAWVSARILSCDIGHISDKKPGYNARGGADTRCCPMALTYFSCPG